ncbi:hypothetical protein J2X03_002844 [Microbacterium trichothecenolyticum]|nr:hypothetical protein [Microbacterium trichothecenolyticum]
MLRPTATAPSSDPESEMRRLSRSSRRGRSGERARVRNPDLLHARPHDSTKHDTRVVLSRVLARKDGRTDAAPHRHRPLETDPEIGDATALRVSAARQVRRACESPKSGPAARETSRQHQARHARGAITRSRPKGRADGCCAPPPPPPRERSGIRRCARSPGLAPRQVRRASGSPKSGPGERETSRQHQARHASGAIARSRESTPARRPSGRRQGRRADGCCAPPPPLPRAIRYSEVRPLSGSCAAAGPESAREPEIRTPCTRNLTTAPSTTRTWCYHAFSPERTGGRMLRPGLRRSLSARRRSRSRGARALPG